MRTRVDNPHDHPTGSSSRCRICTANDRVALIDDLARALWDSRRGGTLDDVPLDQAGPHWQRVFHEFATSAIEILDPDHR
ncbi:hypothetical protein [uncultured Sphingomonas sp.]|uniref:hypothetical protein n=1 Tax=uncultured Sphingomonas sp. TaxID=158754 RepID=UPI0025CC7083|nr:hypothetical protein [uncultured Sphingomonas sp.]